MASSLLPPRRILLAALALLVVAAVLLVLLLRDADDAPTEGPPIAQTAAQDAPPTGLAAADANGDGLVYQSGMHPWIVQDAPGQCPICGMDLMPVRADGASDGTVRIDPVTLQNMGVRTAEVVVEPLERTARTTGRFEANEQATAVVSPKVSGWVEALHVSYEGARVNRGQPLLALYSPELVSTQEEYLLALRNRDRLAGTPAEADAQRLVDAARRRLAYWDISAAQIERLEHDGVPAKTLTLYAPAAGTVTETHVVQGQKVEAGQTLMRLADLSSLWLMADVYEQDLAWVAVGTRAEITLPYEPGPPLAGRVSYLYDTLDPETRTAKARIAVPNPGLKHKPGMYATVTLYGRPTAPTPAVPAEAVVRTGDGAVVILALGDGRFAPAEVTPGLEADGRIQILDGLQGGERIVTSAQFLIDSEARLRSTVAAMQSEHDHAAPGSSEAPAEVLSMPIDVRAADRDGDGYVYQCAGTPHL
ncbi:MAG: efflux RND transporter periplasmic adaptor subunit, partial [Rhodothermales bacterium]|nr:efflux RND transporter periplasmic adaptor subunit [Rhodothermales bacterium]